MGSQQGSESGEDAEPVVTECGRKEKRHARGSDLTGKGEESFQEDSVVRS